MSDSNPSDTILVSIPIYIVSDLLLPELPLGEWVAEKRMFLELMLVLQMQFVGFIGPQIVYTATNTQIIMIILLNAKAGLIKKLLQQGT